MDVELIADRTARVSADALVAAKLGWVSRAVTDFARLLKACGTTAQDLDPPPPFLESCG